MTQLIECSLVVQGFAMRLLLLAGLLVLPLDAAWVRHVMTPKTEWVDVPEPHASAYFTEYPMLRDESGDFCSSCTPEKRLAEAKKIKVRTDLSLIGNLAGFAIYDLYYRFEGQGSTDHKLILVKTGTDQYREIYHREPTQVDARAAPSVFVKIGNDQFLEARYIVGGRSDDTYDYFWFDQSGTTLVDFTPILVAAKALLPSGKTLRWIYEMDGNIPGTHYLWVHTRPLVSRVRVTNGIDNNAPVVEAGIVDVEFRFDHGRVIPTKAFYNPDANR
jgi:hypothetical protein